MPAGNDPRKKKEQWQKLPPPVRADPDKKKRDGTNGPNGPGDGAGGPEASSLASSSKHNLLLQMWQMAVREA